MIRLIRCVLYAGALLLSYPASWLNRVWYSRNKPPKLKRTHRPTRHCVLCDGPMIRDFRHARDGRGPGGQIKKIPEDILAWWRCPPEDGCGRSQQGELKP